MRLAAALAMLVLAAGPAAAQRATVQPACKGRDLGPEIAGRSAESRRHLEAARAATANAGAILWRITRDGVAPSHLFGTVHLTDERVNALPPPVAEAIDTARAVALEVADLSPASLATAIAKVQSLLVFTDGRSLAALLTPDELAIARRAAGRAGMPAETVASLRPWVITMTLSLSDCERRRMAAGLKPLDVRLGERARARRIPVVGLESIEDQLRAMASVPEADQLVLLKAGLKLNHLTPDMVETLVLRYLERDLGAIWPLQELLWQEHGAAARASVAFRRELLTVRNERMREAARPLLEAGGAFIAVGALHLPGDDGLVALLRKAGYTVTPVL
jgi:hypothetical protein